MIINRRLYQVIIDGSLAYSIAADSIDEAISIMRKWREGCNITSVCKLKDDVVLTKEDVQQNL